MPFPYSAWYKLSMNVWKATTSIRAEVKPIHYVSQNEQLANDNGNERSSNYRLMIKHWKHSNLFIDLILPMNKMLISSHQISRPVFFCNSTYLSHDWSGISGNGFRASHRSYARIKAQLPTMPTSIIAVRNSDCFTIPEAVVDHHTINQFPVQGRCRLLSSGANRWTAT